MSCYMVTYHAYSTISEIQYSEDFHVTQDVKDAFNENGYILFRYPSVGNINIMDRLLINNGGWWCAMSIK